MDPLQTAPGEPFAAKGPGKLGYLLVGHGTRNQCGLEQLVTVYQQFSQRMPGREAGYCFLELAEPDIPTAIGALASKGVTRLITVPLLLFSAGHAEHDIPAAVRDACERFGVAVEKQTAALECGEPILALSAYRFMEVLSGSTDRGCLAGDYPTPYAADVGLVMVGRGSSSNSATAAMRRFCELRDRLTPVAWRETAFLHAQRPDLQTALDALQESGLPIAVVQPHLLFEGELVEQLRAEVIRRQTRNPGQQWLITEVLGTDRRLAECLARFARIESAANQPE